MGKEVEEHGFGTDDGVVNAGIQKRIFQGLVDIYDTMGARIGYLCF